MEPKNKALRNTKLAIAFAAASVASAFGSFFSPNTALAEECTVSKAKGNFKKGVRTEKNAFQVQLGKRMFTIPKSFVASLSPEERSTAYYNNITMAQTLQSGLTWECIGANEISPSEKLPTREIPDTTQAPKSVVKKEGRWFTPVSFKKTPPITNDGNPYGVNSVVDMLKANRQWLNQIFERAHKKDEVGGKAEVRIIVGKDGFARKISIRGENINEKLVQNYADFFGRIRWSPSIEMRFDFTQRSK